MNKLKTIFIFAYYSYRDPVFQSAVLPYFRNFGGKYRFIILTFEQNQYKLSKKELGDIKRDLSNDKIILYRTKWHSGYFKKIKKIYDFINGVLISQFIILKYNPKIIYSEGFPGAIITHYLAKLNKLPHIIHSFEPHADYMLEANVWSQNSWEFKIQKNMELKVANGASTLFTGTEAYRKLLTEKGVTSKIVQVPSCVDTVFFKYSKEQRKRTRAFLNFKDDDIVICYLGKFGGMYMDNELFDFYNLCMKYSKKFKLLIISIEDSGKINKLAKSSNINPDQFIAVKLTRKEIPSYLSACDWGFIAVKPFPSKRYCSPIKTGEYWAAGLPIIIPDGISDDFELTQNNNLGITFKAIDKNLIKKIYNNSTIYSKEHLSAFCYKNRDSRVYKKYLKNTFDKLLPQT